MTRHQKKFDGYTCHLYHANAYQKQTFVEIKLSLPWRKKIRYFNIILFLTLTNNIDD